MRILVGSVEIYNENIGWVLSICDLPLDSSNDYGEVYPAVFDGSVREMAVGSSFTSKMSDP